MNFGIIILFLYLALLSGMLFWARRSTGSKRAAIKRYFSWEDHQIRSTAYDDPRIRKFASIGWSLAFVMAGVLMVPIIGFGDSIWVQVLAVIAIELAMFLVGLVVIKELGIMNWYLECYICDFKFFLTALGLTIFALVLVNVALLVSFIPLGLVLQAAAVAIMAIALHFMVSPILKEEKYYTQKGQGTPKEVSSTKSGDI